MSVANRFENFLTNLNLTAAQRADGETKYKNVVACLSNGYYGSGATGKHRLVGSWGKGTRVRSQRDVDVLFELPYSVYQRYEGRVGNKQSQLLQEVKGVLLGTFPNTDVKGDGPVVVVDFVSFKVEVVPAFKLTDGRYWIAVTEGLGRYKTFDPAAEEAHLQRASAPTLNKAHHLTRMMKVWRSQNNVPIRKFALELLAVEFVDGWPYRDKTMVYYDWMVRDYLAFLIGRTWTSVSVPGTGEIIHLGNAWESRARTAHQRAEAACTYDSQDMPYSAGEEWKKVFGDYI